MVNLAAGFGRVRNGYDPRLVDDFIDEQARLQQRLEEETESLRSHVADLEYTVDDLRLQLSESRAQLSESAAEIASLRKRTAELADTSTAPQAMADRISRMLRIAVDEVSEMQEEARVEAESLVLNAQAEVEASQARMRQQLAELASRQRAMETEYTEVMTRAREDSARIVAQAVSESERMREVEALRREQAETELNAELTRLRREAEAKVEEHLRVTAQECELRVMDAKAEAERRVRVANEQIDRRLQDARRALEEASNKRITVLEQLAEVHGTLQSIPVILEHAYREASVIPESGIALTSIVFESDQYGSAESQGEQAAAD